ncbi:LysR family transcriptional regulator [Roseivivax sediminis]|uniref:DNA-binding transcriptional regulator, LysR family n=1 Tax=Roseivivax sediminis TaxID=936889 RepID=A0A1I2CSK3_9RHOB|nr:LysR family transcriptional regulator [Roseivivax sediminis]SFE71142.1 DNA-binding transcriptional regulator, LysR family [Roseivivax sediminis]
MIDKLEMFIAVATEAHFGRAAELLGISQPTLSSGIKQLEDQLGVQLIVRGSRYGGLTAEGEVALQRARQIVGDARMLRDEMRFSRNEISGELRLAVIPTALNCAADLAARFSDLHPHVHATVLSRNSTEILRMIDNLEVDAGLSYLDNEPLGRATTAPLYRESYALLCSPEGAFAQRQAVSWSDLDGAPLALLTGDMQNRRIMNRNLADVGARPVIALESNSLIVLAATSARHGCMTILPDDVARVLAAGNGLAVVPIEGGRPGHTVGLVVRRSEPHTPMIRALLTEARRMTRVPEVA